MQRLQLLLPLVVFLACWQTVESHRAKRGAPDPNVLLWDKTVPIPYIIDSEYSDEEKETIRATLKTFEENTCLNYREDYDSPGFKLEFWLEPNNDASCKADVGRIESRNTKLYLPHSCIDKFQIQHETMHTLGFRHTQTRPDRDNYVIVDERAQEDDAYKKVESTPDYGIPYEYTSAMHYGSGVYGSEYMKPIDEDYEKTFGGSRMIFNDWKLINLHYKCNEMCPTQINCQNGGYQHPRLCTECVCPQFYNGTNCEFEKDAGVIEKMDSEFEHNLALQVDTSYESYQRTSARIIKAPEGTRIRVTIVDILNGEGRCPPQCDYKAVQIVDGDLTSVGKRFCCHRYREDAELPYSFVSKSNVVGWVVFARAGLDLVTNVTFAVEGY